MDGPLLSSFFSNRTKHVEPKVYKFFVIATTWVLHIARLLNKRFQDSVRIVKGSAKVLMALFFVSF